MNNSLAEVHPELVSEWSEENLPLTPYDITFGSNEKVWWKGFIPDSKNGSLSKADIIEPVSGHGKKKYKFES